MSRRILHYVAPVVILSIGIVGAAMLVSARKSPQRETKKAQGPLVEVVEVLAADAEIEVFGQGQVVPRVVVNVVPQVAGTVIDVHPSLVAGGFFAAGEALVVVDPRDYELAVARTEAGVAKALVALEQEQAEAQSARREWQALNPGEEPPSGLVVREPQVKQRQAELESAKADLDGARLNLERTRVSLPFDGVVVSESVAPGQFVGVGSQIATVYGTDVVDVRVPLESRELAWFDLPGNGARRGAKAGVTVRFAGRQHNWEGRVDRMEAELDKASRMVQVVVEVLRPYAATDGRPPLLPGTWADVLIVGRTVDGAITVPRHAVHENDTVWVVADSKLSLRTVEVLRTDREEVLISSGLESGERIVVSALDVVTDGMTVRPVEIGGGDA